MIEVTEFKCSGAIGLQREGESLREYIRRAGYELDRLDAVAEQHRRWHTHSDTKSAECFICAYQHLSRCYVRMLADFGAIEAEPEDVRDQDVQVEVPEDI